MTARIEGTSSMLMQSVVTARPIVLDFSRFENAAVFFFIFFQASSLTRFLHARQRRSCGTLRESNTPFTESAQVPLSMRPVYPQSPVFLHFQTGHISACSRWRPESVSLAVVCFKRSISGLDIHTNILMRLITFASDFVRGWSNPFRATRTKCLASRLRQRP